MNFIVLGAGAIGCYVGARLALDGQQVTLVGRPRVIDPLALNGLTVTDLDGFKGHLDAASLRLTSSLSAALTFPMLTQPTVILLCVKGGATESAAQEIAQTCPPGTTVVSLQNGVDNVGRITANAPHMKALAGMVPYNVVMPSSNHVHRATSGRLKMARSPVSEQMLALFNAAGLATELSDDMRAVQWGKLLINLGNPVNALSDLPVLDQLKSRDYRCVMADLQSEALAALGAAGIRPAQVTSSPAWLLPHVLRLPDWLFLRLASRMMRIDATARSSMWEDVQQGRVTEIDDLCGAVVRLAQRQGLQAPLNAAMCQLIASHRKGQRMSGKALARALTLHAHV